MPRPADDTTPTARPGVSRVAVAVVVAAVVGVGAWAFLSSSRGVEAAPDGTDPACAEVLAALPGSLAGLPRTPQGAAGVAVWGAEGVVLRCGAAVLGPTEKPCLPIGPDAARSVDWVLDAENDRAARFLTFGRDPAVEVTVDTRVTRTTVADAPSVLVDLADAVSTVRQTRTCV
ncbi:DUF3515 family protein [Kineococcus gynurae]|uniref:DUF3515 family protein n=1 Tax=Kineococcus gynurae TaxID=452979 RepID=A0ABV5LVP5_9ACTN